MQPHPHPYPPPPPPLSTPTLTPTPSPPPSYNHSLRVRGVACRPSCSRTSKTGRAWPSLDDRAWPSAWRDGSSFRQGWLSSASNSPPQLACVETSAGNGRLSATRTSESRVNPVRAPLLSTKLWLQPIFFRAKSVFHTKSPSRIRL